MFLKGAVAPRPSLLIKPLFIGQRGSAQQQAKNNSGCFPSRIASV